MLSRYCRHRRALLARRVGRNDRPRGGDDAVDQPEVVARSDLGEEPTTLPQQQRVDHDHVPVHQAQGGQRADQFAAAEHDELAIDLSLEGRHGRAEIAAQQGRVLPRQRLAQGARRHILLGLVEHLGVGVVALPRPVAEEVLIGAPPEQHPGALVRARHQRPAHHLVRVRRPPAPVLEAAAGVLVRSTQALGDAVKGDVVDHLDRSHLTSPSCADVVYTNGIGRSRHFDSIPHAP